MPSSRFAEAHAPLFQSATPNHSGALTERVVPGSKSALPGSAVSCPPKNFVDSHIFGKMQRDGVPHAPMAGDAEFLRRVKLDLTGRIPSAEEVQLLFPVRIPTSAIT
jgi:hypothetical protein